jgi:taurine dioxygenase
MLKYGSPHQLAAAPAVVRPSVLRIYGVEVCTPAIGAEITHIDLTDVPDDPGLVAELRALWLKHRVLFFREQHITAQAQQRFASAFGTLEKHPTAPMHPDAPLLLPLYRNLDPNKPNMIETSSRENISHSDLTFKETGPRGAILRCEACPETGGDTLWANMVLAYEMLPEGVKARIENLYARHSFEHVFAAQLRRERRLELAREHPSADHPVVRVHPETGEKLLFVNQGFTTHFSNYYDFDTVRYGQDFAIEANLLMNYLLSQAAVPEYQVRLKWRPGTVAMWDNMLTQHYAVADYGREPRRMLRATLAG